MLERTLWSGAPSVSSTTGIGLSAAIEPVELSAFSGLFDLARQQNAGLSAGHEAMPASTNRLETGETDIALNTHPLPDDVPDVALEASDDPIESAESMIGSAAKQPLNDPAGGGVDDQAANRQSDTVAIDNDAALLDLGTGIGGEGPGNPQLPSSGGHRLPADGNGLPLPNHSVTADEPVHAPNASMLSSVATAGLVEEPSVTAPVQTGTLPSSGASGASGAPVIAEPAAGATGLSAAQGAASLSKSHAAATVAPATPAAPAAPVAGGDSTPESSMSGEPPGGRPAAPSAQLWAAAGVATDAGRAAIASQPAVAAQVVEPSIAATAGKPAGKDPASSLSPSEDAGTVDDMRMRPVREPRTESGAPVPQRTEAFIPAAVASTLSSGVNQNAGARTLTPRRSIGDVAAGMQQSGPAPALPDSAPAVPKPPAATLSIPAPESDGPEPAAPTAGKEAVGITSTQAGADPLIRADLARLEPGLGAQVAAQIARQIQQGMGSGSLRIQLNPQELGQVDVKLRVEGDRVHVAIVAHQPGTRELIENNLAGLKAAFENGGLSLGEVDVRQGAPGDRERTAEPEQIGRGRRHAVADIPELRSQAVSSGRLIDAFV